MVPARCKLAYIRVGIIAIIGSAATGLISVEKVSNNPDEDSWIQEDVAEDLPPHPTRLCEHPVQAKSQPTELMTTILSHLSGSVNIWIIVHRVSDTHLTCLKNSILIGSDICENPILLIQSGDKPIVCLRLVLVLSNFPQELLLMDSIWLPILRSQQWSLFFCSFPYRLKFCCESTVRVRTQCAYKENLYFA